MHYPDVRGSHRVQRRVRMLPAEVQRRRFTVEEYHRMGETGLLSEDDRVELMDGEIVQMALIGWRHARCGEFPERLFHVPTMLRVQGVVRRMRTEPGVMTANASSSSAACSLIAVAAMDALPEEDRPDRRIKITPVVTRLWRNTSSPKSLSAVSSIVPRWFACWSTSSSSTPGSISAT